MKEDQNIRVQINQSQKETDQKKLKPEQTEQLVEKLRDRFEANPARHQGIIWLQVKERLKANEEALWSLEQMESTGGEPDVVDWDAASGQAVFFDCSKESPSGRRSLCFDQKALEARKKNKPIHSAMGMAADMGIALLDEEDYRMLQSLTPVDLATSSWVVTPDAIRDLGGALFGDCRYATVFIYHNGAESYYAARGFRGKLKV